MRVQLAVIVLAVLVAGCLDASGTGTDGAQPIAKSPLHGRVLTEAFVPIAGATVQLENPTAILDDGTVVPGTQTLEATTDAEGAFTLNSFPGTYPLRVEADEFVMHEANVTVPGDNLTITLAAANIIVPYFESTPFDGYIECALEAFIITPSCDTASTTFGGPGAFQDDSVFSIEFGKAWQTIVLDVSFDGTDHPGIAGMRASAYGADGSAEVFDYERIHQEWGPGPFTLRIDVGADYGDDALAPIGAGEIRFEFFPHGHGDDTVCNPQDGTCFLGTGATQGLAFQAIATVFYHEPAPESWTLLPS